MMDKSKAIKLCSLFLCISMLCCGCQEAPQEVKERMENYGDNKQADTEELKYCSIDDLKKANISDINARLDNMVLPENTDFSKIEGLAVLQMAFEDNYIAENKERLVKLFDIDSSTIHVNDHGQGKTELHESDDSKNRKYFAMENDGFVSFITGMTYSKINDEVKNIDTAEIYEVGKDDLSQKSVLFGKEKVLITDIIGTAEGWLEKNIPLKECSYRVSDAYVREFKLSKGSGKQLSFFVQIDYQGVPLDPYTEIDSQDLTGNVTLARTGIHLNYEGKEQISFFANLNGRIILRSAEPVTEVVDLETAVRLVNEKLASFHEIKIDKLLPLYALWPQYKEKGVFAYAMPGQEVVGRPVYAFLINMDYYGIRDFGNDRNAEHFVYVDMITGEVTTDLDEE